MIYMQRFGSYLTLSHKAEIFSRLSATGRTDRVSPYTARNS